MARQQQDSAARAPQLARSPVPQGVAAMRQRQAPRCRVPERRIGQQSRWRPCGGAIARRLGLDPGSPADAARRDPSATNGHCGQVPSSPQSPCGQVHVSSQVDTHAHARLTICPAMARSPRPRCPVSLRRNTLCHERDSRATWPRARRHSDTMPLGLGCGQPRGDQICDMGGVCHSDTRGLRAGVCRSDTGPRAHCRRTKRRP